MKVIHETKYKSQLQAAPWHDKLAETMTLFQNMNHVDITSKEGFEAIMASEGLRDRYLDMVSSLADTDKETQKTIQDVARHSLDDVRNGVLGQEAADAMGNNANYNTLAKLNSWVIVGYTARSKCLELYHTFSSDDPTVSFKYTLDYIVKGNDPTQYYRPQAERDGDIAEMYDLPQLSASEDLVGEEGFEHLVKEDAVDSTNGGSKVWIKVAGGVKGNFFSDNGGEYDRTKYTLEKNPQITGIMYSIPNPEAENEPYTGAMTVYFDRKTSTGEQQIKTFMNTLAIPYAEGKSAEASIMGQIDLDSGDYIFSAQGPITAIQVDTRLTNVANEMGTIRAGAKQIVEDFNVDNHPYATVPVAPEMSDDFNIAGAGVSAVAYYTDKCTSGLASMRDMIMERKLDEAYAKPIDQFTLFPKLGGWKGSVSFPLAARMAGGSDPYSWMKAGLKTTIINHLARSEMDTYFEDTTPRQWYILGHEQDVNLIPDITYSNWDGEGGVGGASDKFGFNVNGKAGFIDSMGRSVRVIGSAYKRHYQDKKGNRIPMRAVMKSMDIEQPTTLYLPYSFRVYSGISSEYSKRTGLIISARDCIKVMSGVQSRITLIGNTDDLYNAIATSNNVSPVAFPAGKDTITIKAED